MESFLIPKTPYFDISSTLECGQVFRFSKVDGGYRLFSKEHVAFVYDRPDAFEVVSDAPEYFYRYFDFDTDYALEQSFFLDKEPIRSAIEFGKGIHILRQDPLETVFSFIISQNNHIPRIKGIIERMCEALGEDMGGYHAFPTLEKLASKDEDFYASIGAGYRANYLSTVAKTLLRSDFAEWGGLPTDLLRAKLTGLHGVGRKVADCVLLFGFNHFDVFPVDTWIKKAFASDFPNASNDQMSALLVQKYGQHSGFVQQWMFYYKRENSHLSN